MEQRWNEEAAATLGDDLDRLVHLSHLVGGDASLGAGGGGNVSLKGAVRDLSGRDVPVLWMKGTGLELRSINRAGFCALRLDDLRLLRHRESMADEEMMDFMASCRLDVRAPWPSVETPIHALLPYRCISFTHDLPTQALTDTSRKDAFVREVWGDEVAYLGYVRPGFNFARGILKLGDLGNAKGLVIGKQGLVTWGGTPRECWESLQELIGRAAKALKKARSGKNPLGRRRYETPSPTHRTAAARAILPALRGMLSRGRRMILHWDSSDDAMRFVDSELAKSIHRRGMATCEHILRCGRMPLYVDDDLSAMAPEPAVEAVRKAVATFENDYRASFAKHGRGAEMLGPGPRVVLLPGLGIVAAGRDKHSAEQAAAAYRQVTAVMEHAEAIDQFRFLDEASSFEFEYWPLSLARLREAEPELSRRVAVITGAAQGMGRAIAARFLREGAHVVLTDIDAPALARTHRELQEAASDPSHVVSVEADACSAKDAADTFTRAILAFGGVDILVCNAGIVKTGPVDALTEEIWDLHFDVNVKGYWLATREAVRVMKAQGGGSIVFNASKAAFAPALDNSAYATSKAAVAALARNLAVELAPHGIRANYFNSDFIDTPMMRRMIEARAIQNGISTDAQVEEYRKRNLMHVGPIPADAVAEAALFLAGDRSRFTTGSVVTVDGGLRDAMPR